MGYKREGTVFRLKFSEPDMDGLQVDAKSLPLGKMLRVIELSGSVDATDTDAVRELFGAFADALAGWNLEDENDNPVPATLEGLYEQDFDFVLKVVLAWVEAIAGVSAPLGNGSGSGAQSLADSMPMEALSPSPTS